jgi:ribonucleoside-diphosphate reductase alpha chain
MDTIATLTSLALQYGVPLEALVKKFEHVRFEPSGFTKNADIPVAKSLTDYIFRFLGSRFASSRQPQPAPAAPTQSVASGSGQPGVGSAQQAASNVDSPLEFILPEADAPTCADCGAIMVRNGACYKCLNCGSTSGCS